MINNIILETLGDGGFKKPDTGKSVQVYAYHASDVAGGAPNGSLIGAAAEISGSGIYSIDIAESVKVTIVVGGVCRTGMIGMMLHGSLALNDSVDTTAIADQAVTPAKTNFADAFSEV